MLIIYNLLTTPDIHRSFGVYNNLISYKWTTQSLWNKSGRSGQSISQLMEQHITTTEPRKNRSTKCLNASRRHKKFWSIQIGKSIVLHKEKSSTIMLQPESHVGNYPMR